MADQKKVDYWLQKAGAISAVPNMGILSGDSQADMRSFYYSSSRTSTLTREEDDNMTVDDNINAINSIDLFSTTMTTAAVSVPAVIVPMTTILTGGWPKGTTTQMASASMQRKIEECIVQSATEYMRVRENCSKRTRKQVDSHLPA